MSGDTVEIFFTVEPIVDAVLNAADLPLPIIQISHVFGCKGAQDELFVKVTNNRKETRQWTLLTDTRATTGFRI